MDDSDPFHFSDEDVAILSTINALAALQLEEITTRKNLSQEADRLRTLHELVQEMAVVRGYDAIMNLIESSELFDQLNIYRVDDGQPVHGRGGESYMTMRMHEKLMEAMNSGIARWQTQSPVPRNHLALPIQFENRIRGILHICQTELFSEKDIEICSILAEQTATFWALSDLIDQREYEALIDPLTGVWNRRYMIRRLEQEDDRLVRYGDIASVAILDMGEFKLINDVYGHVMGDEVLMQIARLLQNNIRKSDFVGRYGGDEFIIFMPNADGEAAEKQMKRLSEQISEMKLPGLGTMLEADYGIVSVPEDASSLLEGIKIADERMYYFKRSRKRSRLVDGDSTE